MAYRLPMSRIARVVVPGAPHHVMQRGNNRQSVFFDDDDRNTYLALLKQLSEAYEVEIVG